eukprot:7755531-Heterocapsa_arctica.AAC.1
MGRAEASGAHHGGHGGRTATMTPALPSCLPGAGPGGERVPVAPGGIECTGKHPGPGVCTESGGIDNGS